MAINQQAMPILTQEAIQAQRAEVDIVTGATDTSEAFIQSLGAALAQAANDRANLDPDGDAGHRPHCDDGAGPADVAAVATWLEEVDQRFSPYLATSEVCRFNAGMIGRHAISGDLATIWRLCEQTKAETDGYFDPVRDGWFDPSGLVKGWAIERASAVLAARGFANHFVEAGGDIQAAGRNGEGQPWRIGIRNPFRRDELVKVLAVSDAASPRRARRREASISTTRGARARSKPIW